MAHPQNCSVTWEACKYHATQPRTAAPPGCAIGKTSKSLKKVKIELHVCSADGKWHEWYHSDYATFTADTWYKMSFSAVARRVACQILSNSGAVMLETSGNTTTDYNTGSAGFGAYGDGWYFGEFNVEEHDDWTDPWETE